MTGEDGVDASEPHRNYLSVRRFGSLDGLRGLSILGVIWHHTAAVPGQPLLLQRGFLGVDLFFVISGFLIVTLLLRERERSGVISLGDFYMRRTLRIFPIYYLTVLGLAVAYLTLRPAANSTQAYLDGLPYLLTYTINWAAVTVPILGIAWSLATEEQFYVAWPWVERWLPGWGVLAVLAAVLGVNQAMNFGYFDPWLDRLRGEPAALAEIRQVTYTPIALGVGLAHLLHRPSTFRTLGKGLGRRWTPLVLGAATVGLISTAPDDLSGWPRVLIQVMMALLLGSVVWREDHMAAGLLSFRPLARLGMVSYGVYLYHMLVVHGVRVGLGRAELPGMGLACFVATTGATWAMAEASYRVIEEPLLRLKKRFPGGRK